jgi:hypothetical protein
MRIAPICFGLGLALLACTSAPASPFFGDDRFLVVGVSPDSEADALSSKLATDGLRERTRLRGTTFTALGVDDSQGVPSLVRVITARGIALALDPVESHPLDRGARYELLAPRSPGQHDADGDGFDELFIVRRTYDRADACLLVYRVQSSGFVDLIEDANVSTALAGAMGVGERVPCVASTAGAAGAAGGIDSGDAGVL